MKRDILRAIAFMFLIPGASFAQNQGQVVQAPGGTSAGSIGTCQAKLSPRPTNGVRDLVLICGERSIYIGPATGYEAAYNASLDRYLLVQKVREASQIWLVRLKTSDAPQELINVTDNVAAAARGRRQVQARGLIGNIDVSGFAESGAIRTTGATLDTPRSADSSAVEIKLGNLNGALQLTGPALSTSSTPIQTGN
jgi:hypothetical protein